MAYQFIRQEPCYDRILFVLALDRGKMKERIFKSEQNSKSVFDWTEIKITMSYMI